MKRSVIIAAILSATLLSACDNRPVAYVQPAQVVQPAYAQPGYVQQGYAQPVVVQDNSASNLATGMLIGHMLSSGSNSGSSYEHNTVVNKTVIVNNHPAPVQQVAQAAPSTPQVAPKPVTQTMNIPAKSMVASAPVSRPSFSAPSRSMNVGGFKRR